MAEQPPTAQGGSRLSGGKGSMSKVVWLPGSLCPWLWPRCRGEGVVPGRALAYLPCSGMRPPQPPCLGTWFREAGPVLAQPLPAHVCGRVCVLTCAHVLMCVFMYVYVPTRVLSCAHMCVCARVCAHVHARVCMCSRMCAHTCAHLCTHMCANTCVCHVCAHVCTPHSALVRALLLLTS